MTKQKQKRPKKKPQIPPTKHPRSIPSASPLNLGPSWQISLLEMAGPYGWKKITPDHLTAVHDRLKNFESMTWQEIFKSNQNHSVKIDRLATDAKTRLEEMGQSDIEDLVSLRIASRPRIWGILENATLKIIWWDPEHVICPALKKHT